MSKELLARAQAHRKHNKTMESIRGSGFHDADRDWRGVENSPQKQGLPRIGEHLIFFTDEYEMLFVGPDADAAVDALAKYLARHKQRSPLDLTGTESKLVYKYLPRLSLTKEDGVNCLRVRRGEWNDVLHALIEMGKGVSGAPLEPDGTTP